MVAGPARISVVIPCYNHAHYLPLAVESVLAQTRPPEEIVVVDDGSTDETAAIAARYAPRARHLWRPNGGLSAARNTGIAATTGELLAFLDADDMWRPEFLAQLSRALDEHPAAGVVHCAARCVDRDGQWLPQTAAHPIAPQRVHDALIEGNYLPAHSVLLRRACLDAVGGFDESMRASEDWDMWLRLSARFAVIGIPAVLALYRTHGANMSTDPERMFRSETAVVRKHFGPPVGDPVTWPVDRRRAVAGVRLRRGLAHYRDGLAAAGHSDVRAAAVAWPAILTRVDTFYRLGCADQPLGRMGELAGLDVAGSAARVGAALEVAFRQPVPPELVRVERRARGTAALALAMLAYGAGQAASARRQLLAAAQHWPGVLAEGGWWRLGARAAVDPRWMRRLRLLRQRQARRPAGT
jgi:hypothetical protein